MYRRSWKSWLKHIDFILLDILCLEFSFAVAYVFRHDLSNPWGRYPYNNMGVLLIFIDIFAALFLNSMKNVLKRGYYKEFVQTFRHDAFVLLLSILYLFSLKISDTYSRTVLYMTGIFYVVISYLVRILWKKCLRIRTREYDKRSLVIITTEDRIDTVINNIRHNNYPAFLVKGITVIDRDLNGQVIHGVPVVANADTVVDYVCREWVDEVFLNISWDDENVQPLTDRFTEMGVVVHIKLMEHVELVGEKQFVEKFSKYTVLTTSINTASASEVILKRLMDIAGGLAGCAITAVLIVILGPLIYIQSPGPIFFSQTRVGKNGRKFKIYKFRSMYMDAEERKLELMKENRIADGMMFKLDWDPRIIGSKRLPDGTGKKGIGNIIRDWSLDEFPQFFNILKGDMSLVGTRPPTVDEWEKYDYHHRARMAIKPGLTGMWQVSGRSNITDFEEVVALDTKYIKEWSLGLDVKILFKTVGIVLKKEGSM